MAYSRPRIVAKIKEQLASLETKSVHTLPYASFTNLEYFMTVSNAGETKVLTAVVKIQKINGGVEHTVSNRIGNVNLSINPKVTGGNFELELSSQETETLDVTITRTLV